jgi:hypothetical protein
MSDPAEQVIVTRLLQDLGARQGLGDQWDQIDADIRGEIHETWERLVRGETSKILRQPVERTIVEKLLLDMSDRRALRQEWDQLDSGVKAELRVSWETIVREGLNAPA